MSYEARKFGISRQMRGNDAKEKCPDVNVIYVQENRGKADLTIYREAGAEVIKVLSTFSDALERASIDEAYIDLTDAIKRYYCILVIYYQHNSGILLPDFLGICSKSGRFTWGEGSVNEELSTIMCFVGKSLVHVMKGYISFVLQLHTINEDNAVARLFVQTYQHALIGNTWKGVLVLIMNIDRN